MVKGDFVELNLTFEDSFVMAALPEAAFVSNLGPGFGFYIELCPIAANHHQPLDLFSQF
jgi:hypothetical protein